MALHYFFILMREWFVLCAAQRRFLTFGQRGREKLGLFLTRNGRNFNSQFSKIHSHFAANCFSKAKSAGRFSSTSVLAFSARNSIVTVGTCLSIPVRRPSEPGVS